MFIYQRVSQDLWLLRCESQGWSAPLKCHTQELPRIQPKCCLEYQYLIGPCPDLNHVLIWFCLAYRVQKGDTCLGVASIYTDINLWTTNPAGRICRSGCASIWHDHLSRDTIGDCVLFVEHVFVEHHIQTPGNQGTYVIVSSTCSCLKPHLFDDLP